MSLCVIALALASAFCAVTSQEPGDGESVLNTVLAGGEVSSANILNAIGIGSTDTAVKGEPEFDAVDPTAGPMNKFTLTKVQSMIDGMQNGFRYKYDGTVSTIEDDITITMDQLTAMKAQLQGTEPAPATTRKQFTLDEVRTMIDGMNNGLRYNHQGQVSTTTEEIVYTVVELEQLMIELQTQDQILKQFTLDDLRRMLNGMETSGNQYNYIGQIAQPGQATLSLPQIKKHVMQRTPPADPTTTTAIPSVPGIIPNTNLEQVMSQFTLEDLRRMLQGMETAGLQYNYQGQLAQEGQTTLPLSQLKQYTQQREAQAGSSAPTDIQSMPDIVPNRDLGLKSIGQFTLDQIQNMIAGTEKGVQYNYQGEPATPGQATLTMEQLQRFLNELFSQGTIPTTDFTKEDLDRMIQGINNGLQYNYQGQIATTGQAILTRERIEELLAKLQAKGPMDNVFQTPNFTLNDIREMLEGMNRGLTYNYQGIVATPGEPTLTREYLTTLENQLRPKEGTGGQMQTASFTLDDISRMLIGMNNGLTFNYQGVEAKPGEITLTREQLNQFMTDLENKGMGGQMQTLSFTLDDISRMLAGMDNGLTYNYQGVEAKPGEITLTREQLNQFMTDLKNKGMGGQMQTLSFTLDDISRMLAGMDNGLTYNYQGVEAKPGEITLTREQLNQFMTDLKNKGMGGQMQTLSFTLDDISRMLAGMDNGLTYNYQGVEAKPGEITLTREQLNQFMTDLKNKGMGGQMQTLSFTLDDISRMLAGMDNGLTYNYQGVEAKPGEITLTREQLNQFMTDLKNKGMGGQMQTASFTLDDISRMLAGMDNGLTYNYQGVEAKPGEITLTREQLNQFMTDLKNKGMGGQTPTAAFTLDDISRMLAGMDNGLQYNYQGVEANPGEVTLSRDQLNQIRTELQNKEMTGPKETARFTLDDINRMLTGMDNGIRYNYQGIEAKPTETALTREQLHQFLNDLKAKGMDGTLESAAFTMNDLDRMRTGMDQGVSYNHQGIEAKPGEVTLTRQDLDDYLAYIKAQNMTGATQTADFTISDLKRMIAGMQQGEKFNYRGLPAAVGEPELSMNQLEDILSQLQNASGIEVTSTITIESSITTEIVNETMTQLINGTGGTVESSFSSETSESSSSSGSVVTIGSSGGEASNVVDINLVAKGDQGDKVSLGPQETAGFTGESKETTLTDTDTGLTNATLSNEASSTQLQNGTISSKTVSSGGTQTVDVVSKIKGVKSIQIGDLADQIGTVNIIFSGNPDAKKLEESSSLKSSTTNTATSTDISAGTQTNITITDTRSTDITTSRTSQTNFTFEQINRMINGTRQGLSYNYQGLPAQLGEDVLTIEMLNKYLADLNAQGSANDFARFTLQDITRMAEGIRKGETFNRKGLPPAPNEQTLTIEDLDRLRAEIDARGTVGQTNTTAEFTIPELKRLIDSMNQGETFNYQGLPAAIGDPVLSIDQLYEILTKLQNASDTATQVDVPMLNFSIDDINRIIDGIRSGNSYNYQGLPPSPGEKTLTIGDLTKLLEDLNINLQLTGVDAAKFTLDDIKRMLAGMERGISYNFHGQVASPEETKLTRAQLNAFYVTLAGGQHTLIMTNITADLSNVTLDMTRFSIDVTNFTLDDINRMLKGMDQGQEYNIQGKNATAGEPKITREELNQLMYISKTTRTSTTVNRTFTITEIERMFDGMDNGLRYNHQGNEAGPQESILTRDELTVLLLDLLASSFNRNDIDSMLTGLDTGEAYNYQGKLATGKEQTLTRDMLNRLLGTVNTTSTSSTSTRNFTLTEIERMFDGMDNGLTYNYQGNEAGPQESTITRDELTVLLHDLLASRFNRDDIIRMLSGIDRGEAYNYQGNLATGGERTLTRDLLNRLLTAVNTTSTSLTFDKNFTLTEIERMFDGMDNGLTYNYQGNEAGPQESTLTRDELTVLLLDLLASRFNPNDIDKMLTGLDRGEAYNYQGNLATGGERTLTRDLLNRLRNAVNTTSTSSTSTRNFTLTEIERMFDGMDNGLTYNYQGNEAGPQESTLTRDELTVLLLDLLASRFNPNDIDRMLTGLDRGEAYNYQGNLATGGERTLTRDLLNRLLTAVNTTSTSSTFTRNFTLTEIERMFDGMDNGLTYNYQGNEAGPQESTITRDELTVFFLDLLASRFNRNDIIKMLNGLDRGVSYNYQGNLATGGERTLTRDLLNRLLGTIKKTTDTALDFTLEQVLWILDGMNKGFEYDYTGRVAMPGDQTLSRDELILYLLDLLASHFTQNEIKQLFAGMDRGEAYNYRGKLAESGEPELDRQLLTNILPSVSAERNFTQDEILNMIDGMDKGLKYDFQGNEASPSNELTFTKDDLTVLLFNLLARSYNLADVNQMLENTRQGSLYSYHGHKAIGGERAWSKEMLEKFLQYLISINYANVAARKPAELSTVYSTKWGADKGVDENRNSIMLGDSCFHTNPELKPFFLVDLEREYNLKGLLMINRQDCCGENAENLQIYTGNSKDNLSLKNEIPGNIGPLHMVHFTPDTNARYVKIQSNHKEPLPLHLCEVELYGTPVEKDKGCIHNGFEYPNGHSFKDDCNTCKCIDGNTSCTQMACDKACFHNGNVYADGESFKDDCNICRCNGGIASCTKRACGRRCFYNGTEYVDDEIFVDDCNTCRCVDGSAICTKRTCGKRCLYNGTEYADGQSFKDDCNTCTCNDGNTACTTRACGKRCYHNGNDYADGESFKDDCNTCICNDGTALCTLIACGSSCYHYGVKYADGETFKDDCNTCRCVNGNAACTEMACGRRCFHNGIVYSDGESFKDDCNTCRCNDGNASCTQMACGGQCYHNGNAYADGEIFKDDCNTCRCNNGTASCTRMACGISCNFYGVEYADGESFKDDCNTCSCVNGNAVCTQMACGRRCYYNGMVYADGESFKDDCNTCRCNDGNASCTKMACGGRCYYKGNEYADGEIFKDDCNTCRCNNGTASCTRMACGNSCNHYGVEYADGETFKDDCNTCRCVNGNAICTQMTCGRRCYYNGVVYADGESFKDDCNTCRCNDGNTTCTLIACGGRCIHNGIEYADGESFKDDCNTCTCNNGNAACTKMACGKRCYFYGTEYADGEVFNDDCNTCRCIEGNIACTQRACGGRCYHNGVVYADGESFKDDCNTCICNDGNAACSIKACGRRCYHNGSEYADGEIFKDDCNICRCTDGNASCTELPCGSRCYHKGVEYGHGERFQDDCNSCRCSDGIAACTRKACGRRCYLYGNVYFDGEKFMDDCNNCTCSDGNAACTQKACGRRCYHNGAEYADGDHFNADCNNCTCNDGNAVCTKMACGKRCYYNGMYVHDGASFENDCNTCTCIDGLVSCTQMACVGNPCFHNGIEYANEETFKDGCNTCTCYDGNAFCTLKSCENSCLHKGVSYYDGEKFMDDCNTCTCAGGNAACTLMACPLKPCYHNGVEYADGERFKDDCNTCSCHDGNATCTQMECVIRDNIALNKTAEMSSTFKTKWSADKGVDGKTQGDMFQDSCFHTKEERNPYWILDLGAVYTLNEIEIYNRDDCCSDRLKNLVISTGLTRDDLPYEQYKQGPLGAKTTISLPSQDAQFIQLQIRNNTPSYLHVCEVVVHGSYVREDLCAGSPCLNGGTCTNKLGTDLCNCTEDWTGSNCEISRSCFYNGLNYTEGESFMDDCNTCRCTDGRVACTKMECVIHENIALNKNAEMSSALNTKWSADKAIDGNRNPNMFQDSCFHTKEESNPYWILDLGAVYSVDQIEIYNRADCCGDRLKNLVISTGLTRDDLPYEQYMQGPLEAKTTISLPSEKAQFIQLQIRNNTPSYLHVCEVVVNGNYIREDLCAVSPCLNGGTCTNKIGKALCNCVKGWTGSHCQIRTDNIAYNKPTELSSLFQNNIKYGGDKGADGDTNGDMGQGSCFHTEKERQPYWMVDLGAVYELQRIVLFNRQDTAMERARDIEILVGLTKDDLQPVYYHAGELGPMREIPITSGTEGQYVMVHIKDLRPEYLHLCEVEVYGIFLRRDRCKNNPCRHGGTCTNKPGAAICDCPTGYSGIYCGRSEYKKVSPVPGVTDSPEPYNGSRVDPAICRRAQCNLPICYVPYETDCSKYVVCQRTAIGAYVAWKMRCAFGSYWGTGRTWTCQRVEDLARQGYVCPNDPCANSSLHTYPDEDITNCRTYWSCFNGISKPACCPQGQAFNRDTLQCESDPQDFCRSPCPLKIDGCLKGAQTAAFYDGNCRTYWNCQSGHPHPVCCDAGRSYDFVLGYCKEDITCTDICPADYTTNMCSKLTSSNPVESYSLADGNCRTYMKCTKDGYDDPYCCRQDYFYNSATRQCQLLEDAHDKCRHERCPRGYKEECRFTPIAGSPKQFYDSDAEIVRDCAPGTTFAPEICTCEGSSLINVCKAEVWAKFDQLEDRWSVKNYGDGWISVFGDMSKNRTAQGVTYGTFDGSSGMEVWRYDHTALREATLEITFQPVASGNIRQILVSNCMSVDNGDASFEVSLDPQTSKVIFKGKTKFDAAELSLPYNRQGWNTFKLFFDGEHLVGVIEDPSGVGQMEKQATNLRGDITAGVGALKFGPCLDSFSMPKDNGFTGFVSEVIFSKCIDERGRQFIMRNIVPEVKKYTANN